MLHPIHDLVRHRPPVLPDRLHLHLHQQLPQGPEDVPAAIMVDGKQIIQRASRGPIEEVPVASTIQRETC
jgi:hypothetical protein